MSSFKDKIALVTGASRGLGFATAKGLAEAGTQTIALARTVGGLEALDEAAGGGLTLVPLDVTDDPGLERMGAAIHERWGRLDLWVHTAIHATPLSPVPHIAEKDFDRAHAVNVRAVQRLIRVLDPLLREAPAARAVFFDDAGAAGNSFHASYLAAKAGARVLTELWARENQAISELGVLYALPPAMPTSLRARFHPGEDRNRLTDPSIVAARLLAQLAGDPPRGTVLDLRNG